MARREFVRPIPDDNRCVRPAGRRMARALGKALLVIVLVGCAAQPSTSSVVETTPTEATTNSASLPPSPSINAEEVAAEVATAMRSMCVTPVDELLCSVVQVEWISFENGILSVPTTLAAEAGEDAEHLCSFIDSADVNHGAEALRGIEVIDILGATNALITSCGPDV